MRAFWELFSGWFRSIGFLGFVIVALPLIYAIGGVDEANESARLIIAAYTTELENYSKSPITQPREIAAIAADLRGALDLDSTATIDWQPSVFIMLTGMPGWQQPSNDRHWAEFISNGADLVVLLLPDPNYLEIVGSDTNALSVGDVIPFASAGQIFARHKHYRCGVRSIFHVLNAQNQVVYKMEIVTATSGQSDCAKN